MVELKLSQWLKDLLGMIAFAIAVLIVPAATYFSGFNTGVGVARQATDKIVEAQSRKVVGLTEAYYGIKAEIERIPACPEKKSTQKTRKTAKTE